MMLVASATADTAASSSAAAAQSSAAPPVFSFAAAACIHKQFVTSGPESHKQRKIAREITWNPAQRAAARSMAGGICCPSRRLTSGTCGRSILATSVVRLPSLGGSGEPSEEGSFIALPIFPSRVSRAAAAFAAGEPVSTSGSGLCNHKQ